MTISAQTRTEETQHAGDRWLALGALAVLLTLVVRNAWVTEDAYLTLRTIDNWVHGHGLRWNVGERVQAYTHPLWMLLMTLPYVLLGDAYAAALVSGLLVTLAAALAVIAMARSTGHAVVAIVLLLLSRSFIDYSTSGLENPLNHLLVAGLVWLYAIKRASVLPLSLCAALLALNRTDALLVAIAPLGHTLWLSFRERGAKPTFKSLGLGFAPYIAWQLFSLVYYGFLVPNTAFAKLNTGIPRGELVRQGATFLVGAIAWDPALLAVFLLGLAVAIMHRQLRTSLLAGSALLYVSYVVLIGGDFMQGRFLTIPVFLLACVVAISPLRLQDGTRVALLLAPLAALFFHPSGTDLEHAYSGVEDEREFYEDSLALSAYSRTQAVPHHVFRDNGERFADAAANHPVQQAYNVGITGFYAGPRVHVVDVNALADPLLARLPIRYDPEWRIGHYTRTLPVGYLESLASGRCEIKDLSLCEYYGKLKLIIAGDVWSWERFTTIVRMNVGSYESLIDRDFYRYPDTKHVPLTSLASVLPENGVWNDTRALVINHDGVEIDLGRTARDAGVSISFDGNDSYSVEFRRGPERHQVVSSRDGGGGMRTRTISVPAEMRAEGFDRLLIRPLRGDGMYSVGYVRLGGPS